MSYADGWAALNLEMPDRVPRSEYSADGHWPLLTAVTGIEVDVDSPEAVKKKAQAHFFGQDGWNYDFFWSTLIHNQPFGDLRTDMGHSVYAAGGVDWRDAKPPLFKTPEDALKLDPAELYGLPDKAKLVRLFESHYQANVAAHPDGVNMTGIYVTMISGLIEIFGWEMLLLAAGTDRRAFGELANRYGAWMQHYFDALAEADVPAVMVHDDIVWTSGPFIQPEWYRAFVFPNYKRYLAPLIESGKKVIYTSDGNYNQFIDDIAACGIHCFVMEPTTDMAYIAERYGKTHAFVGNADTRILLLGTQDEIRAEVERCMAIGKDCPGFFMAVGNHIPSNTPIENALFYNEVYKKLSRR
ncbi:MAG: hypothetical protein KJZ86_14545 [Caldilineaceae bacterium]|nr:hypothetical protein [Caldilineaceae bacterium]HRJ42924.1 uroporphyrinogen decarboxylase family protein [Caldilineaceae bacterium]